MKKKIIKLMGSICIMLSVCACDDFLEVGVPKDQLDNDKVFHDGKTATAAVVNVYSMLRNNGFLSGNREGVGYLMGCYTDELKVVNTQDVNYRFFYNGTVLSTNAAVKNLWNYTYQQIYAVNNILEGLDTSGTLSNELEQQLKGEALAIRGILHFYLTMTYGDVPYITTTNYNTNRQIAKLSSIKVLDNAVQDLKTAVSLLSENYISAERVRINKNTAQALLARVLLYRGDWVPAIEYAQAVLDNGNYKLEDIDKVFLKESKSALWQLKPDTPGKNTLEGTAYSFTAVPAKESVVSEALYNSFDADDLRKSLWFKSVGAGNSDNIHAYKYKQRGATGTTSLEYSVVVRLEEVYLIMAECAAYAGDWEKCSKMLNLLRQRSGLTPVQLTDEETAVEAVLQERKKELFCEFGHRFYDLKRRGKLNVLLEVKPFWSSHFEKLPLPETELQLNPNLLPQNNGY